MMREDAVAESALITQAIRDLQDRFSKEHQALVNWSKWSRDRRGIYPAGITAPAIYDQAPTSKWEFEEPDYDAYHRIHMVAAEKGDKVEEEEYDEKTAVVLDERIHGPGGLSEAHRSALEVAYVARYIPEDQMHRKCSPPCQPHGFRERLEECLRFVGRFV
jgi:hypothetical protein